jgi:hypothetical protein
MSPIVGFSRMRRHQFGAQSVLLTPVAATRRLGVRGVPTIEPNWTDQDEVDTGSIDPALPPYRTALDITQSLTHSPLNFNDIPLLMSAGVIGGVSGSAVGAGAYTWTHAADSLAATTLDYFTDEFADDANNNDSGPPEDGMQLYGGIIETLNFSFGEDLGPWQASADWRFAGVNAHVTPTAGLQVSSNSTIAFGADTALYIDDTSGGIGGTQISDSLHSADITITNSIDVKRFANGSNSRFQVSGYGLAERVIEATFRFAKTSAIVAALNSETVDWLSADPVNRYINLVTTSTAEAESGTPYSWDQRFSGTWRTRTDAEVGGNSVVELTLVGRYDAGLGYPYRSLATNTLATLP